MPEILNADQCLQFTSNAFRDAVLASGAQVLMDGVGPWTDNVFIERLWWSLKHEEVHGKDLADGFEASRAVGSHLPRYNDKRPHQALTVC